MNTPLKAPKQLINVVLVVMAILFAPVSAIAAELVDINNADAATMIENWKGIGEKKARAIVAYRKKNGKFTDINDLANVDGIGEGLIKNNRKYMSLSKGLSKPSGKSSNKSTTKKSSNSSSGTSSSDTKKKSGKKETAKKSSTSKKPTSKKSTTKKSTSKKKSKSKKCKKGSNDADCKATKKSSKKKSTT